MRIRGAKTELEEAGESTDGMAKSTASLRAEIKALSGVDIMASATEFKSTYAIMDELSQKWKDLTDIQQASIIELMAGKHQGNVFASLMQNFQTARDALDVSVKSSGSALKEHTKWSESIEARLNRFKATWQSLSQSFMNSGAVKFVIDALSSIISSLDAIIRHFGSIGTIVGGIGLFKVFGKNSLAVKGLKELPEIFKSTGYMIKDAATATGGFKQKLSDIAYVGKYAFKDIGKALSATVKELGKLAAIMAAIKAVQDIVSWLSELGEESETAEEKFNRLSEELSGVDSELSGLESELSSVESQIDALLEKDKLSFTEKEELSKLQKISSELEYQIELTEALQESLKKSLSDTSVEAYQDYINGTSFYSKQSKAERKEETSSLYSSIGNIIGLAAGAVLGYATGGASWILAGAGLGSAAGSMGGSYLGGVASDASYDSETNVADILDNMHAERVALEKAKNEAYKAYVEDDGSEDSKESWIEATAALNDYNTALANHISAISQYVNSVDYSLLEDESKKQEYLAASDYVHKYNIEMGVKGAKEAALDQYFSDEFITKEAENLRYAIEDALNTGEDIHFYDLNIDEIIQSNGRLKEMGITVEDLISYFKDLEEAQGAASNYETYDMVSSIAALSDGVEKLTSAFEEFNNEGIVSAKTLVELNGVFGDLGEDWTDFVDVVTSGTHSIEDARNATEQLAESYFSDLLDNGGIKFINEKTGKFDKDKYNTYLSTIGILGDLGIENAKEYFDAAQQEAMIRDAANRIKEDTAEKLRLTSKDALSTDEELKLNVLKSKNTNSYISEIEKEYGIEIQNRGLVGLYEDLAKYERELEKYNKYGVEGIISSYSASIENIEEYRKTRDKYSDSIKELKEDGIGTSDVTWSEVPEAGKETLETLFGWAGVDFDTDYDKLEDLSDKYEKYNDLVDKEKGNRKEQFEKLIDIANNTGVNLTDLGVDIDSLTWEDYANENLFGQIYDRVETKINQEKKEIQKNIDDTNAKIKEELDKLGLDIEFGRSFDKIVIGGLKGKIEKFNAAKAEMSSSGGISTDSIISIEDIFGNLEGYDYSKLFEHTANGVHLNTQEFKRLSDEFKSVNIAGVEDRMSSLNGQYEQATKELSELTVGTEEYYAKLRDVEDIEKQIGANQELLSQYKDVFSSFREWQTAESAGSERNMYESIIGGLETVKDEISRGWIDDGTVEFLELLTGRTDLLGKSGAELKEIYDGLDDTIKNTSYSIRDFFTVDEDGNSTNAGVYNFLDAIDQLEDRKFKGANIIEKDGDGNIIGFDFELAGGDEAIAEALGISEELVQIMVRAADDAGFIVTVDGSIKQLKYLQAEAQKSADYLREIGKTEFEFDFTDTDIDSLKDQLKEAKEILKDESFWNEDGTFNVNAEGAEEAMQVVSTLQYQLDNLTAEQYGIGLTTESEEYEDTLKNLQDYGQKVAALNQLELNPRANAAEIEVINTELDTIAKKFINLPNDKKIEIGLVGENGEAFTEEYFNSLTDEKKIEIGLVGEDNKPIDDYTDAVRNRIESGEIEIPAVLDIQANMDENIETLVDLAWINSGLLSEDEEKVIRQKYNLIPEVVIEDIPELNNGEGYSMTKDRFDDIQIVAKTFGIEDIDDLSLKLKDLDDKTIKAVAEVVGQADVDLLKQTMAKLTPTQVEAIAKAIGKGDVDELKTAISELDPTYVQAIAEAFGYSEVKDLYGAIENLNPKTVQAVAQALGITDVEGLTSAINNLEDNDVYATAHVEGKGEVDGLNSSIDTLKGKDGTEVTIKTIFQTIKETLFKTGSTRNDSNGFGGVNGTAHANGTTGVAFKQGNWRTKKSETALTGEIGREIVVTPNNEWYTVGDDGAEFVNIPRGSIVFNHKQTEELLKNGKATSDRGRAKALVSGTAFSKGTGGIGKVSSSPKKRKQKVATTTKSKKTTTTRLYNEDNGVGASSGVGNGVGKSDEGKPAGSNSSSSTKEEFEETFDWVEVAIERIERAIDKLDQKANNIYKTWSERNKALVEEIGKVQDEIELQQSAYERYMQEANSVGLSSSWAEKVRNGKIDINTIKDEALAEKIKEYQEWFEKAIACQDAIEELKEKEAELYAQRVENVATQYEGILGVIEHEKNMLDEYISQSEAQAWLVSGEYYKALADNERNNLSELEKQKEDMLSEMQTAMESGKIAVGSEAWHQMVASIDEVTLAIAESQTQLLEYEQTLQQLSWEQFDLLQEKISAVTEEADFLIELLSSKKLFDDNGQLTNEGSATMGLHGQNYNTYMYQADQAAAEAERLRQQLEQDPYDTELEARYREMIALQQEYILAAQDEKEAIRDLVEEGIQLELDALQERIDKYNEAIESQKDLYEYQKKVKEQAEKIASLEKQRAAYLGDTSEEAKAKLQEIEVSLEEAREELKETEYDRYISDQQKILDDLYIEYEEILNMRLDNIDALLEDMIAGINANATTISETLATESEKVGYTMSNAMSSIWNTGTDNMKTVLTTYGEKFSSAQTTTNNTLNTINTNLKNMITQLNSIAKTNVKSASTSSAANSSEANPKEEKKEKPKTEQKPEEPKIKVGGKINAKGAQIYDYAGDKTGERQLYRNDPIYTVLKEKNGYLLTRWHKLSSGYTGWFKKSDVKAYASGAKKINENNMAWTQENGQEYIIRPSDGAILTPVAKGDSVLTSAASGNIWNMANNPTEFIRDNLKLDTANVPIGANVQNSCVQNFENITFSMPNVRNYEQLVSEMQRDPKFEKLILAMTVDQIAGKSKLAKNKAIR